MDVQISWASSLDLESIVELQSLSMKLMSKEYNAKQIESLLRSQKVARTKCDEIIFVAYHDSKLVGLAALFESAPIISALFVHPDFIRRGIGNKLLQSLEDVAIERKYKILYVQSSLSSANFYRKKGYKKTSKSGFWDEGKIWIPTVSLQKRLIPLSKEEKWSQRVSLWIICLLVVALIVMGFLR